jgi:hypothetical protein
MKKRSALLSGALLIACLLISPGPLDAAGENGEESTIEMKLHHLHIMMNHGLSMATEDSNLVMFAQMGMVEDVDSISFTHGKIMMARARDLFDETTKGKVMMDLHRKGYTPGKAPLMKMTHELAEAEWKVPAASGRRSLA